MTDEPEEPQLPTVPDQPPISSVPAASSPTSETLRVTGSITLNINAPIFAPITVNVVHEETTENVINLVQIIHEMPEVQALPPEQQKQVAAKVSEIGEGAKKGARDKVKAGIKGLFEIGKDIAADVLVKLIEKGIGLGG